jgi:uncharacterized protein YgbK (DUF1537 family)
VVHVELDAGLILRPGWRDEDYLAQTADRLLEALKTKDAVLSTSRDLVTGKNAAASLKISGKIADALTSVVAMTVAKLSPRFIVAKGGITSIRVAGDALQVTRAFVRGSMRPGMISLWELKDDLVAGMPYVVFPGITGTDEDLTYVVQTLSQRPEGDGHGTD